MVGTADTKATEIVAVNPTVVDDGEVLSSDSSKFTIMGKGFDASNANLHTFSLSGNVKALLGSSAKSTHTSLEISFTHLSPLDEGNLNAAVTVNTTWASSGTFQFSDFTHTTHNNETFVFFSITSRTHPW